MAYLGTPPQSGFITTAKQRVTSSTNNYVDLDHSISSIADVIVFVNFVKQDTTNLSLTTSTRITLGGTLVSSDIVEIHYLGKAVNTQTPATGTVTADALAGSIGLDKLSATGTKSSSTFLRGDNTFASAGGITEADQWRITAEHSGVADITTNWERVDTDGFNYIGTGMSESSGIFTFPSTGIYLITFNASGYTSGGGSNFVLGRILTTLDNSSYSQAASGYWSNSGADKFNSISIDFIFDVTSTSTHKCKFRLAQNSANTPIFLGNTSENYTCATFIRIGDT